MKRIGVYLGMDPEGGGAFQYSQSILDAALALPTGEYEVVVAHAASRGAGEVRRRDGRQVRILAVHGGLSDRIGRMFVRMGLPAAAWLKIATMVSPTTRRILDQRCDLWIFPAQDAMTYLLPVPAMGTIHDLMHRHEPGFPEVGTPREVRRRDRHYRAICRYARAVMVDSQVGADHVAEAYDIDPGKLQVLPYVTPACLLRESHEPADGTLSLPQRFFFYPAQFWEHKNHARLVEAFAQLVASGIDYHLVLVGAPKNAYAHVTQLVSRLDLRDRVHLHGYVGNADMVRLYQRARALIMPTFFGPTNIPPLEAMALGCPMAISRVYAMPEQAGDAAIYFDPRSTDEIAGAMRRLAEDDALCQQLARAGRERTRNWDQAQFARTFQAAVERVLAG